MGPLARVPAEDPFRRAYELIAPIGAGGMGSVFRARQRSTGREVAIKFLTYVGATDAARRFQLEAEALSALQHPHVMVLLDAGEVGGYPYLVTELLAGGTLRTRLVPGQVGDPDVVCEVVAQILAGLAACHERGILHRDLKPENIMFDGRGQVKLADLGLAKQRDEGLTMPGEILGTPLYMSPEQLSGGTASAATDLFAVGVMFYEYLFGQLPLSGETLAELIGARCTGRLKLPPHALPAAVVDVLTAMLATAPEDRQGSAAEALRQLTAACAAAPASAAVRAASGSFLRPVTGSFPRASGRIVRHTTGRFARTSGRFERSASGKFAVARPSVSVPAPSRAGSARAVLVALVLVVACLALGWQAHARFGASAPVRAPVV